MKIIKIIFLIIFTAFTNDVLATNIQIFTDTIHPVNTANITSDVHIEYYKLDQLNLLIKKINQAIHNENKENAAAQTKKMIIVYKHAINHAVLGMNLAQKYEIKKIPAIVFDQGKYIVFGQISLQKSFQEYKQWLNQKK